MDEARRFMRYLLPGLLFVVETFGLLYIVLPSVAVDTVKDLNAKDNLGFVVATLVASGGLGFLFSSIHHWLHWLTDLELMNHTAFIDKYGHESEPCKSKRQKKKVAQIKFWALWYTRFPQKDQFDVAEKKTVTLGDLAHAIGAARIASVFALVTVLIVCFQEELCLDFWPTVRFICFLFIGIFLVLLFDNSYRRVSKIAQGVTERILGGVLDEEQFTTSNQPLKKDWPKCRPLS